MNKTLIGRDREIKILNEAFQSKKPELIAVVERRRVGKTFLIKETYKEVIRFELTGLQYANKSEQLQNFIFAFRNYFPKIEIESKPTSWLEAFYMLSKALEKYQSRQKQVVFLDELPWLGTKKSGFITALG